MLIVCKSLWFASRKKNVKFRKESNINDFCLVWNRHLSGKSKTIFDLMSSHMATKRIERDTHIYIQNNWRMWWYTNQVSNILSYHVEDTTADMPIYTMAISYWSQSFQSRKMISLRRRLCYFTFSAILSKPFLSE